jgi:hypothetical protein
MFGKKTILPNEAAKSKKRQDKYNLRFNILLLVAVSSFLRVAFKQNFMFLDGSA